MLGTSLLFNQTDWKRQRFITSYHVPMYSGCQLEKERYGHLFHTVLHMFSKGLWEHYRVAITSISTKASLGS